MEPTLGYRTTIIDAYALSQSFWKTMIRVRNRNGFESFFVKDKNWGTIRDTLRIGIQLYSTRFQIGPLYFLLITSTGAQVGCRGCSEFRLRFYHRVDFHWYVSLFIGHGPSCIPFQPGEPNYFMKPQELAMILKSEYPTSLPSQPAGLKPLLEQLELYPHSYSPEQIHTMTASIMQFLRSSNTIPFSLSEPSSSNSRRRHPATELPSQLVLQGLTTFREEFLKGDPDNRFFIDTSEDGTYKRSTMIIGPVVRLSIVNPTGQYDLDGTYFKLQKTNNNSRSLRLPGFLKGVVYSDGNNCYYPIAIQHDCEEESEEGYRFLLETLWREAPHTATVHNAYGSDRDSGLLACIRKRNEEGLATPNFIRCTVHIKRNVASRYPGKQQLLKRKKAIRTFEKIAYCKRKDQTIKRLDKLQSIDMDLYEYLMKIEPELYCDSLMTRFRTEKLTSNSVESLWANTMDCRSETRLPLFFKAMNNFAIYKLYKIEKEMELCVEDFTPYACEHIKQRTDWGVKKGIRVTQFSSTRLTGTTSDTKGRLSSIDLNTMACTCQARQIQSLPCACQMIFIIQTGKINLLSSQFVHSSFRISSWREALRAAIDHPSSFGPCSSSSLPAFQRILPFDWAVPTQPTPESFRFPPSFGLARGRPQAPVQNRQLDVRRGRGRKRTLYGFLGVQDPGPPSNATSDPKTSSESEEEPEGTPERTSEEGESSDEKDQSQDLYPTLGNCTGCSMETSNLHGCTVCRRPTHLHCVGRSHV